MHNITKASLSLALSMIAQPVFAETTEEKLTQALKEIAELKRQNQSLKRENNNYHIHSTKNNVLTTSQKSEKASKTTAMQAHLQSPVFKSDETATITKASSLTGFYAGINGGYGGGDINSYLMTKETQPGANYSATTYNKEGNRAGGAMLGGQIGYNYIMPNSILLGGEFDFDWSTIAAYSSLWSGGPFSNGSSITTLNPKTSLNWISTLRGRIGYVFGDITPYLTAGFAYGQAKNQNNNYNLASYYQNDYSYLAYYGDHSKVLPGWVVGAGIEYQILPSLSLKTEYIYSQLGSLSQNIASLAAEPNNGGGIALSYGATSNLSFHHVRFGVNYHLPAVLPLIAH